VVIGRWWWCAQAGKKRSALETAWKVDRMPRTCTICRHVQRHQIEADLQAGLPYRDVARHHDISHHALWRHWANHVSRHSATALATVTKIIALLEQAETASMWNTTLVTLKAVRRCVEELLMQLNHGIER
jgi:hypothetical protein